MILCSWYRVTCVSKQQLKIKQSRIRRHVVLCVKLFKISSTGWRKKDSRFFLNQELEELERKNSVLYQRSKTKLRKMQRIREGWVQSTKWPGLALTEDWQRNPLRCT